MPNSLVNIVDTAYVNRLLNSQATDIVRKMFLNFTTADIVRRYAGVKKTLDIGVLNITKPIVTGYSPDFDNGLNVFDFSKVTLSVGKKKAELKIDSLEDSMEAFQAYLAGTGSVLKDSMAFNTALLNYLIGETVAEIAEEMEIASWQAIVNPTNPLPNDPLPKTFNGYIRQVATICSANGSSSVISTGAIDQSNAVDQIETFWSGANKRLRDNGYEIFCSWKTYDDYKANLSDKYKSNPLVEKLVGSDYETALILRKGGGKSKLRPIPGITDNDVLIGSRPEYLAMGFEDLSPWKVQDYDYYMKAMKVTRFGVAIRQQAPGYLTCNDRLISTESSRTI